MDCSFQLFLMKSANTLVYYAKLTPTFFGWIVPYVLRLRELCGPEIYVPNWVGEKYLKNPEEMLNLKH